MFTCLQFQGWKSPCDLSSLMVPGIFIKFQFPPPQLLVVKRGVTNFKIFLILNLKLVTQLDNF